MGLKRGVLDLVVASALWGTIGIATQVGYEEGAGSFQVIVFRNLTATLLVVLAFRDLRSILNKSSVVMGVIATLFYEVYIYSVEVLGASLSAVFLYTAPVWVVLASRRLGDRLTWRKVLASLLVVVGVYLIYFSRISLADLGWGLASGLTYAFLIVYSRYMQLKGFKDRDILASQSVWSLPFSLLFLPLYPQVDEASIATGAYLGVVATFLAYLFFYRGMRATDSITATVISSLEPVFTIVFALVLLHQTLTPLQYLGSGIIIMSSVLVSL